MLFVLVVFFQAEDGIRYLVRSRGLGDVYKRQPKARGVLVGDPDQAIYEFNGARPDLFSAFESINGCLLYTSDAADERSSVDLGGRRTIKKKKRE